ncbi:hypothetical protein HYALB_00011953 [Hymenoscyphus albidus]|uniref:FAD-binding domain-containing protein n=1 Tax=Hymenoscyphus albidus TaxID=595503 RepID=A0A9N9Q4I5_9HELO|nr:hypothetical protein HYALB_00011953 [Hymenoscyphus albidus]
MPIHVLISGAGVAGPALAWFLAKSGSRVTIVEKAHTSFSHGQNIDIKGSAVQVIKKMGLLEEVRRFNTTEMGTQFIDSKGKPFAPFPVQKGLGASFTSEYEILRGDLAEVFHQATKDHPDIKYYFGTTIKNVISNNDTSVEVELSSGDTQQFDLLVAADGQWSKVRKQCFPSDSVKMIDLGMYSTYWTVPRLPSDNSWWNIYLALKSRDIHLRPDPHNTIRAMFTIMPCNDFQKRRWKEACRSDRQTQEELLKEEFADAGWQAQRLLEGMEKAPDFYFQKIQQVRMSKWSSSRVVCLGDAANCPSPLTGMGTSLAIIGAYVLGGELSKLDNGEHPSKALESYESIFRPFVEEIQKIPWFVPGIAHPETAWKRWLVQSMAWTISKIAAIPWVAGRFGPKSDEEDFQLPLYSSFENVS